MRYSSIPLFDAILKTKWKPPAENCLCSPLSRFWLGFNFIVVLIIWLQIVFLLRWDTRFLAPIFLSFLRTPPVICLLRVLLTSTLIMTTYRIWDFAQALCNFLSHICTKYLSWLYWCATKSYLWLEVLRLQPESHVSPNLYEWTLVSRKLKKETPKHNPRSTI